MKQFICMLLAAIMILSIVPTALATTDYSNGTDVVYDSSADNDGDGQPDHSEEWVVTVPAKLTPGSSGNVKAQGTWASDRTLVVTADTSVTLSNSINNNDTKVLNVSFDGIELPGSNTAIVTDTKPVSVQDIQDALFGTWSGVFYYQVEMTGHQKQFIGYSYNGNILSQLEPVDDELPYKYLNKVTGDTLNAMLGALGKSDLVGTITEGYFFQCYDYPAYGSTDPIYSYSVDAGGSTIHQRMYLLIDGAGFTGWMLAGEDDSTGFNCYITQDQTFVWANTDVYYENGDLLMKATPIIPIYQ